MVVSFGFDADGNNIHVKIKSCELFKSKKSFKCEE